MKRISAAGLLFVLLIVGSSQVYANSIVDANNKFCFDLYARLRQGKNTDNIFFSSFSISTALGMTYEGARGNTALEMAKVFGFPAEDNVRRVQFSEMLNEINKKDKKYELRTANALWVEKTYKLLDDYLGTIEKYYQGRATNVGFIEADERDLSRMAINQWVESNTNNKIRELIKPQTLTQDTRLVLTNAVYFKGSWQIKFTKSATKEEDFFVGPGKKVKVPMMSLGMKGLKFPELRYAETADLQVLELPYEDGELSMLILLPKKSLDAVEEKLDYEMLESLRKASSPRPVKGYLPRFKFEKEYSLKSVLVAMGMPLAFSDLADFSGMDGTKKLTISEAIHKAFVEVNEEGTEAAAATGVIMVEKVSVQAPAEPVTFRADHPFIFMIRHNKTDAVLFMGRVLEPSI